MNFLNWIFFIIAVLGLIGSILVVLLRHRYSSHQGFKKLIISIAIVDMLAAGQVVFSLVFALVVDMELDELSIVSLPLLLVFLLASIFLAISIGAISYYITYLNGSLASVWWNTSICLSVLLSMIISGIYVINVDFDAVQVTKNTFLTVVVLLYDAFFVLLMTLYAVNLYKLRQFNKKSSGDGEMNPAIRMMILLMQSLTLLNLVCYLPFGCYINAVAFGHGNEIISHTMQYALVTHPFVTIKGLGHFIALEYVYHFNNPFKREDTVRESSFNMQPIFVPYPDAEAQEIEGVTPTNNHRYTF